MGGHGHGPPYTVQDYKQFKIEGIPQLEELEQALAKKVFVTHGSGMKHGAIILALGHHFLRARKLFFRGFPLGLALTVATVAFTKLTGSGDEHHDHGHH